MTWSSLTAGASTTASSTLSITTAWTLATTRSKVELDASFSSAAHALSNGATGYIPSSAVFGSVSGADTVSSTAFTGTPTLGTAGAAMLLFSHTLTTDYSSTRVDVLTLSINLLGVAIPAGSYTGTLTLLATAI